MIKKLSICLFLLTSVHLFGQEKNVLKMDVPVNALGENQNFQVISFEPLADDKYSILYMQELPASVVGDREFRAPTTAGAYTDTLKSGFTGFVNHSNKVIILVRQILNNTGEAVTDSWVIAVRELQSDMPYTMYFPPSFVHPVIKDAIPVTYSLKNLDRITGLSEREFGALVSVGKQKYGFYQYPASASTSRESTLGENLQALKSGFKELKAVMGKGKIALPKEEKVLFRREIVDNVRLAATKIDKKDSVEIKLYISMSSDSEYELVKSQTYFGSTNPLFATALVYDVSLNVAGAYGWVLLKFKDAGGASKAHFLALGIDNNAEPHFWSIDAGKNSLNSFMPVFSYYNDDGINVVSRNQEKIFKPYYQYHLLKADDSAVKFYPATDTETGSEKSEFVYTEQEKKATSSSTTQSSSNTSKTDVPSGIFEWKNHKFLFTTSKVSESTGTTVNTHYGNLSVIHINRENKITENYDIQENKSNEIVYPLLLGQYSDKAYFLVNYPNKFKLVVSEDKVETETLENSVYRLVYLPDKQYVAINQYGTMLLTKSIVGNKYTLEFYPVN